LRTVAKTSFSLETLYQQLHLAAQNKIS